MTLKNICKLPKSRSKIKQRRRSGVLSPLVYESEECKENANRDNGRRLSEGDENTIYQNLVNNEFLKNVLSGASLHKLIDCMYLRHVDQGDTLMEQGLINSFLFISKSGTYEVTENHKRTETFNGVRVFGELAILHSTKASQSVKAASKGSVWVLDSLYYKNETISAHMDKQDEIVDYLRDVPSICRATEDRLYSLSSIMHEKSYPGASLLLKEGEIVDTFFIVKSGGATILSRNKKTKIEKLTKGCFFGDHIFLKEMVSLYSIVADPCGVECLTLSRVEFLEHYQDLDDFLHGDVHVSDYKYNNYETLELKHLKRIKTLGVGGFGRVELVQNTKHDEIFALKMMKKYEISGQTQIKQIYSEKELQMACDSDFIVKLYKTFKDTKYIYFLLEPCMGGDLWNLLRRQRRKCFDTDSAKFYAGCILEALDYLHSRHIIYRDLKPENVMISSSGYPKLTDFGFAKKTVPNEGRYSFVGTAEYIAPELVQNLPHDKGVDYWALGVFIFELLVGKSPFRNDEHSDLKTYKAILKGIDFVTFPYIVSPRARNLIKKLCRPLSVDRIGCQKDGVRDIQSHSWFSKFDWDKLRRQELEPPIRIFLNGKTDTRYFDTFKDDNEDVLDDYSTWDKDF